MKKKIRISHYLVLSGLIIMALQSCIDKTKEYEQAEAAKISSYLSQNSSLNFEIKPSGLYYLEVSPGEGLQASTHDTAYVFYTLYFLDGTQLGTNAGTTDTLIFPVNEGYVIPGFDEGITYMKAGGNSLFLLPSKLAYGTVGNYYNIPGFTPLLFNVSLARVKPGSAKK